MFSIFSGKVLKSLKTSGFCFFWKLLSEKVWKLTPPPPLQNKMTDVWLMLLFHILFVFCIYGKNYVFCCISNIFPSDFFHFTCSRKRFFCCSLNLKCFACSTSLLVQCNIVILLIQCFYNVLILDSIFVFCRLVTVY